jgi:hypothetical protein
MKRLSIALAAIGLSVGAFAALPAATDPTLVAVPQFPGGFFIGLTGYYLEPAAASNDLSYGYFQNQGLVAGLNGATVNVLSNSYAKVDPGYDWGWGINGGYLFPGTANDVYASYFYLNTSDTNSSQFAPIPGVITFTIQNANQDLAPTAISFSGGKAEYNINQVEVDAGQYMDVGCRLVLHPSVGLRWAQVDRTLTSDTYENFAPTFVSFSLPPISSTVAGSTIAITTPGFSNYFHTKEESDFSGIGPEVGLDASYYVDYGFGFVAHAETGLLIGSVDTKSNFENVNPAVPLVVATTSGGVTTTAVSTFQFASLNSSDWRERSTTRVVPVTDLKLGANYTYLFNNATNSDLTLEAGWQVSEYMDSVDRTFASAAPGLNGGAIANIDGIPTTTSSVGFEGPYVNLTFHA